MDGGISKVRPQGVDLHWEGGLTCLISSVHFEIRIHICQLPQIIQESTDHQISWIKSSYKHFCALIWNLSHFLRKFESFLFIVQFLGLFCMYFITDRDYFAITIILMVCTLCSKAVQLNKVENFFPSQNLLTDLSWLQIWCKLQNMLNFP